jgi:hypothetical protein
MNGSIENTTTQQKQEEKHKTSNSRIHKICHNACRQKLPLDGRTQLFSEDRVSLSGKNVAVIHPGEHPREVVTLGWALTVKEVHGVVDPPAGVTLKHVARGDPSRDDLVM